MNESNLESNLSTLFLKAIKKRLVLIILAAFLATVFLISTYRVSFINEQKKGLLLHPFTRQQVLSQQIVRDSVELWYLLDRNFNEEFDDFEIRNLHTLEKSLGNSMDEYENIMIALESGKIKIDAEIVDLNRIYSNPALIMLHHRQLWNKFQINVQSLLDVSATYESANFIDERDKGFSAFLQIKTNGTLLLTDSELMSSQIRDQLAESTQANLLFSFFMIGLSFFTIILGIMLLKRIIITPLAQVYKEFSISGLVSVSQKFDQSDLKKNSGNYTADKEVKKLTKEISLTFDRMREIIHLIENINRSVSFNETLRYIFTTFSNYIPYDFISVGLYRREGEKTDLVYTASDGSFSALEDILKSIWADAQGFLHDFLNKPDDMYILNNLFLAVKTLPDGDMLDPIQQQGINSLVAIPLFLHDTAMGVVFFASRKIDSYASSHVVFLKTISSSIAISIDKHILVDRLVYSNVLSITKLTEARDADTGTHLDSMTAYAVELAVWLKDSGIYVEEINTDFINQLERFCPLHDIGKVGEKDGILLKPGKLSNEERIEMQKHPLYGAEVLKSVEHWLSDTGRNFFNMAIEIVMYHHEHWDGKGYPTGAKGQEIPLSARIAMIADVFDALTSERPYKPAYSFDVAIAIMQQERGTMFEPLLLDEFLRDTDRLYECYSRFPHDFD